MSRSPLEITEDDTLQSIFTKFGAYALDKQENLADLIEDKQGELDLEKGYLSFTEDLTFPVQILGILSKESDMFSWAWDNDDLGLPESLISEAVKVKEFGEKYDIPQFKTSMFKAEINEVHYLAMTVIGLFDDDAYYPVDVGDFVFFVTIKSDKIPKIDSIDKFQVIFDSFQRDYDVNGKRAFEAYVACKDYPVRVHEEDNFQVADIGEDKIMVGFSDRGNVNLIKIIRQE